MPAVVHVQFICSCLPQVVQERLVCHGIVGRQGCNKLLMSVDVTCHFVAPMLSISSKQLKFYIEKVGQKITSPYIFSSVMYLAEICRYNVI